MSKQEQTERQRKAAEPPVALESLRKRIDEIDEGLVDLIAARLRVAQEAAAVKEAHGLGLVDLAREAQVVRRAAQQAREKGLEPEVLRDVFWRLIGLSRWASDGKPSR